MHIKAVLFHLENTLIQSTRMDIDKIKVEKMRNGEVPIYEPHLDALFDRNIKEGRLSFTTQIEDAVADAEIIFLALPTPPGEDGAADLSYIYFSTKGQSPDATSSCQSSVTACDSSPAAT